MDIRRVGAGDRTGAVDRRGCPISTCPTLCTRDNSYRSSGSQGDIGLILCLGVSVLSHGSVF